MYINIYIHIYLHLYRCIYTARADVARSAILNHYKYVRLWFTIHVDYTTKTVLVIKKKILYTPSPLYTDSCLDSYLWYDSCIDETWLQKWVQCRKHALKQFFFVCTLCIWNEYVNADWVLHQWMVQDWFKSRSEIEMWFAQPNTKFVPFPFLSLIYSRVSTAEAAQPGMW